MKERTFITMMTIIQNANSVNTQMYIALVITPYIIQRQPDKRKPHTTSKKVPSPAYATANYYSAGF